MASCRPTLMLLTAAYLSTIINEAAGLRVEGDQEEGVEVSGLVNQLLDEHVGRSHLVLMSTAQHSSVASTILR